eukprot:IDg7542t1
MPLLLNVPGFAFAILPTRIAIAANASQNQKRPRRASTTARPRVASSGIDPSVLVPSYQIASTQTNLLPLLFDPTLAPWLPPPPPPQKCPSEVPESPEPRKKAVRKPHGFWNDLANVERELETVNAALGRRGRRQMPRLSEMSALGRGDLIAALAKHGGSKHVALMLRWSSTRKSGRKLPTSLRTQAKLPYTGVRTKLLRREADYWADLAKLELEVKSFARLHGVADGAMPTQALFRAQKRTDLLNAIARHGGLRTVASSMGFRCVRSRATMRFDFVKFTEKVLAFAHEHCPGKMPTAAELGRNGACGIANAVAVHGGYPAVARRLGLELRNTAAQGAPATWDQQRLGAELRAFTRAHYPDLALANQLPTERQLRKEGRNDLSYAVQKFGGFTRVMESLAFACKRTPAPSRKGMGARARAKRRGVEAK